MEFYRITLKNQIRAAKTILLYLFVSVLAIVCIYFFDIPDIYINIKIIIALNLIINGPAIYLHFSYYLKNKNYRIKIFEDYIGVVTNENKQLILDKNNILSIELYMSPNMIRYDIIHGLATENYNYIKFILQDQELVITNLIYTNLKEIVSKFDSLNPNINKTIFANI